MKTLASVVVVACLGVCSPGWAMVVNGSFEAGLTGWSVFPTTGVNPIRADVKNSSFGVPPSDGSLQAFIETSDIDGALPAPLEALMGVAPGSIAALGDSPQGIVLYQDVMVSAGDVLSFDYNMLTEELTLDGIISVFDDPAAYFADGSVQFLQDVNATNFQLSAADLRTPTTQTTETGYIPVSHTFVSSGVQRIGFGVFNDPDISAQSALLIDNVRIVTPVPAPGAVGLLALAVGLLGAYSRTGRK